MDSGGEAAETEVDKRMAGQSWGSRAARVPWLKIVLLLASLFLFLLSLMLMKTGAKSLGPLLDGRFAISNPLNSLGFGWLFAYVVMSGSPVAASALTIYDAGLLSSLGTFTMISGSRLGSSLVVLIIGIIYVLRGRDRSTSLNVGLLSFTVTGSLHLGTLIIGALLLQSAQFQAIRLPQDLSVSAITEAIFDPIVNLAALWLPSWGVFLLGLLIMLLSFNLFDRCLPQMSLDRFHLGAVSRLVYRPPVMFLLGAAITLVSFSVSVSLSLLVPLSHRGFVRRENIIPYIMGANITTFIDTLFTALLLNNPTAVSVVLAQMVGVALISLLILASVVRPYERVLLRSADWVTASNRHLAYFMFVIIIIPILLLLL